LDKSKGIEMSPANWQSGAVVIGCRENTAEFIEKLLDSDCPLAGIVTISEATADRNKVPSWTDLSLEFGSQIPVYTSDSYKLENPNDISILGATKADVGFCIGWQRLLPQWFLNLHHNGVFGMHACANRLPNGRGRSPINWSVIEGASSLFAHIFRYNDEPDAGDLLGVPVISIEPHDDIQTLQQKARVVFNREVIRRWPELLSESVTLQALNSSGETERFYPKRSQDDGLIDWTNSARQITDWVRAQTHPYPGAFTLYGNQRYSVWRCGPTGLQHGVSAGTVVEAFRDGTCFVACGENESVHLLHHDLPRPLKTGKRLGL
jgi:methionyl-tRNA formyltransferase